MVYIVLLFLIWFIIVVFVLFFSNCFIYFMVLLLFDYFANTKTSLHAPTITNIWYGPRDAVGGPITLSA